MGVDVLTTLAEVQALVPQWRELLEESATNEITLTPEWLLTWWDVFGGRDGRQLRFVAYHEDGRLVGLAPLLSRRHWYWPGVPFRRLEPLASGERAGDAICSDYLTILARQGMEDVVAYRIFKTISSGELGPWDELVIPLMDGSQVMPELLVEKARGRGLLAEVEETTRAWYVPLPGSWEAYLKQLGKKERYLINRTLRDFEQWAGGEWSLECATKETLAEGQRVLHGLHHERWEGEQGGVFRSPLFLAFHDRLMPLLLDRGALELLWLRVRGANVAAMYNVTGNRKTYFYQCGRSRAVPRHIRPGGVLIYLALRRAIAAGHREFDFLGGDAVYKRQLALASRPLVQVRLAHRGWREQSRRWVEWGKDLLRPWKHRLRRALGKVEGSAQGKSAIDAAAESPESARE